MTILDDTNQAILRVLRANARESVKGIAAQTGLARSTVRNRIERMENDGIIKGYRVDLKSVGQGAVEAFLLVHLSATPAQQVIDVAASLPEVQRCYSLSGEIDLIVEVQASNIEQLNKVRDVLSGISVVTSVTTSIILNKDFDGIR